MLASTPFPLQVALAIFIVLAIGLGFGAWSARRASLNAFFAEHRDVKDELFRILAGLAVVMAVLAGFTAYVLSQGGVAWAR